MNLIYSKCKQGIAIEKYTNAYVQNKKEQC